MLNLKKYKYIYTHVQATNSDPRPQGEKRHTNKHTKSG